MGREGILPRFLVRVGRVGMDYAPVADFAPVLRAGGPRVAPDRIGSRGGLNRVVPMREGRRLEHMDNPPEES